MPLDSLYLTYQLLSSLTDEGVLDKQNNTNSIVFVENIDRSLMLLNKLDKLNTTIDNEVDKVKSLRELQFLNLKNFIKEVNENGFLKYNLTKESGLSVEHINYMLEGTELEGLGEYYVQAEKEYGVNAVFLVGLSALESAWGNSRLAKDRNNIFGFMAYDRNVDMAKHFDTKGESILYVAKYLKENYLTVGGKYYNGTNLEGVNVRYSTDSNWCNKIASIVERLVMDLKFGVDNGILKKE